MIIDQELVERNGEMIPKWMAFITDGNISKEKFQELLSQECQCGNEIRGIRYECTKCYRILKNWKYEWSTPKHKIDRWLLLDKKASKAATIFIAFTRCDVWKALRMYFFVLQSGEVNEVDITLKDNNENFYEVLKIAGKIFNEIDYTICPECDDYFGLSQMELHHKISRSNGGIEEYDNLILLCIKCHHQHITESLE